MIPINVPVELNVLQGINQWVDKLFIWGKSENFNESLIYQEGDVAGEYGDRGSEGYSLDIVDGATGKTENILLDDYELNHLKTDHRNRIGEVVETYREYNQGYLGHRFDNDRYDIPNIWLCVYSRPLNAPINKEPTIAFYDIVKSVSGSWGAEPTTTPENMKRFMTYDRPQYVCNADESRYFIMNAPNNIPVVDRLSYVEFHPEPGPDLNTKDYKIHLDDKTFNILQMGGVQGSFYGVNRVGLYGLVFAGRDDGEAVFIRGWQDENNIWWGQLCGIGGDIGKPTQLTPSGKPYSWNGQLEFLNNKHRKWTGRYHPNKIGVSTHSEPKPDKTILIRRESSSLSPDNISRGMTLLRQPTGFIMECVAFNTTPDFINERQFLMLNDDYYEVVGYGDGVGNNIRVILELLK